MQNASENRKASGGSLQRMVRPHGSTFDSVKHEESFFRGYPDSCVPANWLNLLYYLPLRRAVQGQSEAVWRYEIRKEIHDNPKAFHLLGKLEAKLKEIFPQSFLFQLTSSQIEYRNDCPRKISLETLENLYHQILSLDLSGHTEAETCLAQVAREAWQRTQMPIPHKWLEEIGDDFLVKGECQRRLTWVMDDLKLFSGVVQPNDPSSATRPPKTESCNETAQPGSLQRMVRRLNSCHALLSLAFEPSQSLELLLRDGDLKPHVSSKVLDAYQAYVREAIPELELVYRKRALVLEKSLCRIFADEYKIGKSPNVPELSRTRRWDVRIYSDVPERLASATC